MWGLLNLRWKKNASVFDLRSRPSKNMGFSKVRSTEADAAIGRGYTRSVGETYHEQRDTG